MTRSLDITFDCCPAQATVTQGPEKHTHHGPTAFTVSGQGSEIREQQGPTNCKQSASQSELSKCEVLAVELIPY